MVINKENTPGFTVVNHRGQKLTSINVPEDVTELPEIYNQITDEINGNIIFDNVDAINYLDGFYNIKTIGGLLSIEYNSNLIHVTGFDNLVKINGDLLIGGNGSLIVMSLPGNIIRSVDYKHRNIFYDINRIFNFKSPEEFINSPVIICDMVHKFNPGYHGDQVINQIIENVEEWGTEETKEKVYSHLISHNIDNDLFTQEILNKYHIGTIKNNNKIISEVFGD